MLHERRWKKTLSMEKYVLLTQGSTLKRFIFIYRQCFFLLCIKKVVGRGVSEGDEIQKL